ncbi:hypothetical protein DTO271D3_1594 [Paecilomyces variotii]|nr:hypothetical protein DTO271D3_1594 [Paecilomyces variotii]
MAAEENRESEITRVDMPTWDRYDKLWCLRALWDPAEYQSFRESQLKIPRDIMARWPNWPEAIQDNQERIHWILTHTPDGPTVPETEPTGLSRLAYHCIETLKHILEHHSMLADSQKVNILAALEAYRSGRLDPKPGDVTYWYAGVLKEDPGPQGSQSYAEAMDRSNQCGVAVDTCHNDSARHEVTAHYKELSPINVPVPVKDALARRLEGNLYTATSPGISGAGNLYDPGGADLVTAQQHLAGSVDFQAYLQNVHNNGGVALQGQQQGVHLGVFELPREAQRNVEDFSLSLGQAGSAPAVLPKTDGIHRKA